MPRPTSLLNIALIVGLMAATALAAPPMSREFVPVQDGFSPRGEVIQTYAPDRLLVQFDTAAMARADLDIPLELGARTPQARTGLASVDALLSSSGLLSIERPYLAPRDGARARAHGVDRWFMLRFDGRADVAALQRDLRNDPNVSAVSLDWVAFPAAVPNDPLYADHWGHDNTGQLPEFDWGGTWSHTGPPVGTPGFDANAPGAWDVTFGTSSVVIAILDSGVDVDHPDLNLVAGYDFGDNDSNPDDDSADPGHGTACAGVAASVRNNLGAVGIAADCSIMPCKVANSAGSMYFSAIQNALYWAADNGADVISMSLGAPLSSDPATDSALEYAFNQGCVILAATGNENVSTISYPAIHADVIGVGAASPCGERKRSSSSSTEVNPGVSTDPNGYTCDGERWWGSNYGSTTQDDRGAVDVIAPTILPTTDIGGSGGYNPGDYDGFFNGTSCATPYAAGVAALIIANNATWTPTQVRDQLVTTAADVVSVESGAGWDRYTGYGMVDAAAALGGGGPVAPTAAFTGAPTSGTVPLAVQFTDQSTGGPTSWSWTFGDGGTSNAQNPSHTYAAVGTYTVSLTVSNDVGSDTSTLIDYITVTEPGVTTFVQADGETPVIGTVTGSYLDTYASDDAREVITEVEYTGHPRKRYSYLEHRWNFSLPTGGDVTFHLEASRTSNAEGDDMLFEYTTDGATWLALATVTASSDQTFAVPLGSLSGSVTVRATDTDRNWENTALDQLAVDYLAFEVGDAQPTPPVAAFSGTPTSGEAPLTVQFTDASTGDPTSWSWTFGDGGTASTQNPGHTYADPGVYTVALTATNAQGSDTVTRVDYITVTEPGTGGTTMHVDAMLVSRQKSGPNYYGVCDVTILDDGGQPVDGATVTAAYDGPTSGTATGVTAADGTVTLQGSAMKRPSGEWCFEVTGVTHGTLTYDPDANVVTRACESGAAFGADAERAVPTEFAVGQNHPNPFNPMTVIAFALPVDSRVRLQVFDLRGRLVATLADGQLAAGHHEVTWDARQAPSGMYVYRLDAGAFSETRKMSLLK
jgi:PKD repeat protein